ncbi:putative methyltransferase [Geobacter sp. OR-1]|uniref:B12-binding domain-containing radical SAM protein n=1 Tax=Geobacter sp. OR-1 TaxID=1266765 RepID=UPI0005440641|nr:radical SAM protein [Geobacter sp. OR-1]GAM10532.1 putative methyltransferase [Geobacter sp. OR-1]
MSLNAASGSTASPGIRVADKPVTILRPPVIYPKHSFSVPITPPIAIASLAATLEKHGYRVDAIDAIGEDLHHLEEMPRQRVLQGLTFEKVVARVAPDSDILAVSVMFSQEWPLIRDLLILIKSRNPGLVIIAGGEHITALPAFSLRDCAALDYCGTGEGEGLLLEFIAAIRSGKDPREIAGLCYRDGGEVVCNPRRHRISDLDSLPWPAWDKIPIETYLSASYGGSGPKSGRTIPIVATRGCPFRCSFCSSSNMWGQRYVMRSPANVIDEIKLYSDKYRVTHVHFYDLTAIISKEWILEFCRLYREKNLNVVWCLPTGTRSEALDQEVIESLAATNCRYLVYAPESGSPATLKSLNKELNLDALLQSVRIAVKQGIITRCNLVVGFPGETIANLLETLVFQLRLALVGVDDAPLYLFAPYPGSELFEYLRSNNRIPEINDEYFDTLIGQMVLSSRTMYTEKMSGYIVALARIIGMSLFYGLSYLLRPRRIARSFINIFVRKTTDTVFEQRILEMIQRRFGR